MLKFDPQLTNVTGKNKIKFMSKEQLLVAIDRLTRFKDTESKYLRVFKDIISNYSITPKYKKKDLDNIDYEQLRNIAQNIINHSIKELGLELSDDYIINQRLYDSEMAMFNIEPDVQKLLVNNINYKALLPFINEDSPINLRCIKSFATSMDVVKSRQKNKLRFPIEKIILTEGITEEILLPEFAKICGYDFDENGVQIISAGGKNQVVKYFYRLYKDLKVPIFVLFDNDAKANLDEIKPKLRKFDKIHLVKSGEFEDLLPISLVRKTLNDTLKNFYQVTLSELTEQKPMVEILEEFYKLRGLTEFKKAEFALSVKNFITSTDDVSQEIMDIIKEIRDTNS